MTPAEDVQSVCAYTALFFMTAFFQQRECNSKRRPTCDCCKDASGQEFGKILEMKDIGVAIYRYFPQVQSENQESTENGQVYIIQNIGGDDVKLEALIAESGNKRISCPRCLVTIEYVKSLLKELPPANIQEVTGICVHCYRRVLFNCPCSENVIDKFVKFRMEDTKQEEVKERNKMWLIKTQLSLKKSFSNLKDSKPELEPKPEDRILDSHTKHKPTLVCGAYKKTEVKVDVENEQKKNRPGEEDAEKELSVQIPLKEFIVDTHKLETGTRPHNRDLEYKMSPNTYPLKEHGSVQGLYEKQRAKRESELLQGQNNLYWLGDTRTPIRDQMAFKPHTRSEGQIQESQIPTSRYITTKKLPQEPTPFLEMYEKETLVVESEMKAARKKSADEILGKPLRVLSFFDFPEVIKSEPKKEKTGILKSPEEDTHKGFGMPYEKTKSAFIPPKRLSFETVMKSLSEPNVSDFSYSFPHHKITMQKPMKYQISSSELIKNTQEMLQEREESEKKKKARLKEEKNRLAQEEKRKRKEEKANKDKSTELEAAGEEADRATKTNKQDDVAATTAGEEADRTTKSKKQDDVAATTALKEQLDKQSKELSEDVKTRKQFKKDMALGEKIPRKAHITIEGKGKQLMPEKKIEAKTDSEVAALKDQAAKQSKETLIKKKEQDIALGEKVEEKPAKEQKVKDTSGDITNDMAAVLKEQMAKKHQQEFENEKLRREQEKERELAEKRLRQLQTKKEDERAPVIKPVILESEIISDDEDISDTMLKPEEVTDIIKGQKIYRVKSIKRAEKVQPMLEIKLSEEPKRPTQQKAEVDEPELKKRAEQTSLQLKQFPEQKPAQVALDTQDRKPSITGTKKTKPAADPEASKGVIRYTLSDRTFIDKGWTMLPTEKVVRKMNVYRMRPAKPEFDWFEHNKYKRHMTYDSGERLAEFDDNGRGRWYYRSGELALDYYDAEETNAGQRFVVYSTGQPDERGRSRPRTILATFDFSGNGIVFDHTGKIRLKYNQTEGVVLDRTIGPVSHWKWHTLNDPPVLQQVMIDTQMPLKDPTILMMGGKNSDLKRPDNEEMIAIEFENFLKEKRQKLTQSFKPFQIKMKAMKINENFSLRVMDQASVYLLFRDGKTNLKINLGMVLDHKEIVDTNTAEIGEVSNTLDNLPACTDSIAGLQRAVAQAQAAERTRVRHERRLRRAEDTASVDALHAACSRKPATPIVQASLTSCDKMTPKRFKPSCCELYYSTQLC